MTRDQLHIAFKIALDKNSQSIAFGGCPAFLPEEIDYWLNQGMYQEVSNKFTGLNTLRQPFEKSVKRVHDLEKLIINNNHIALSKANNTNECIAKDVFVDKMFYIDGMMSFDEKVAPIVLIEHSQSKRFKQAYNNLPHIETPVAIIENNDLKIYIDPISMEAGTYSLDLTYVKNPTKIEDIPEGEEMIEFPEYMQNEIVNRAVELALENIESKRTQTKSSLNQIDE